MKFQAGKTYTTRSIGDHNCIISVKVLRRTAKTIWVEGDSLTKPSLRIFEWRGVEHARPWGNYSMAPIVSAEK